MTPHEVDISWSVLRDITRRWAGEAAELESVTPLAGGSINTTIALGLKDNRKAVLKITPHRVVQTHADEEWQLRLIADAGAPAPEVYFSKIGSLDDPFSYILMEYIEGLSLAEAKAICSAEEIDAIQSDLARLLLKLHSRTNTHFQRALGRDVKQYESWPQCYREFFDPIWAEVEKSGALPIKCRKMVGKIHERLERFIEHDDCPRLLHWDLWAGNLKVRCDEEGQWRIAAFLDPHCKYGHAEVELAYMELFSTSTPVFMKAYQRERKLAPEYHQVRKPVYQLYSMLNDLHLFGQEYLKPTLAAIERVGHLV
ncbi:MAG TPA: fructosamine kinase family protein [Tepidisphaeraceae bacterium]|jgi:fructosamine-3-kinase|nr:fructosamine kinase family protein [Tepidisphaeraceae bacterium]